MIWLLAILVLAGTSAQAESLLETFGSGENQFQIEFVTIGNPNNAADTTGSPNPVGSVPYVYNLGKYEVSRDMVLKASTAGGLGLTLQDMTNFGGNGPNKPATGISWNEAARFVNWLNTSKGYQVAYKFDSTGSFQLWGPSESTGTNYYRHRNAVYFLPSTDEWYKAAYYDPKKTNDGGYWKYPVLTDNEPESVTFGTNSGTAVFGIDWSTGPAPIHEAGGLSAYGTGAQGGNAFERLETAFDFTNDSETENRGVRGGGWTYGSGYLDASFGDYSSPSNENFDVGFRVAMVPEPSSLSLLLAGGAVLMLGRRRKY